MVRLHKLYKVYRNLHNGKLSIKNSCGLVAGHCDSVILTSVKFKVNRKGIARIQKNKRKEVIATANGNILSVKGFISFRGRYIEELPPYDYFVKSQILKYEPSKKKAEKIYFNPYKHDTFYKVESNGDFTYKSDVHSAFAVAIDCDGLMLGYGLQSDKA